MDTNKALTSKRSNTFHPFHRASYLVISLQYIDTIILDWVMRTTTLRLEYKYDSLFFVPIY